MSHSQPQDRPEQPSRRGFLKTASAVAAGGALAGGLPIARAAHAAGDDEIKIALIGCGGRGNGAASQALKTKGKVKLWAMCDAFDLNIKRCLGSLKANQKKSYDREASGSLESRIDVPPERQFAGFDGYQKAIDSGVDMVILATPPGFRPIHFEAAVKAGKHVFMEKPVAVDAPGIRRVLAAAEASKQNGLCVGVGLQRRHQAPYVETVKRLQDGAIGDILLTRVYWNGNTPWVRKRGEARSNGSAASPTEMEYQMFNWYFFNWICGDHICEQHIHNLDVSNWVKDATPVIARGMGGRQVRTSKETGEIFDHHAVEFEYADGSTMMSQCRHMPKCWNKVDEFAAGTKGRSHIGAAVIEADGERWKYSGDNPNPYQQEHDDLFAAIRSGATDYNEAEYGATSTMTSIFGRMATYSGKELKWDDAINSQIDLSPAEYDFNATPPVVPNADGYYPIPKPGVTRVI